MWRSSPLFPKLHSTCELQRLRLHSGYALLRQSAGFCSFSCISTRRCLRILRSIFVFALPEELSPFRLGTRTLFLAPVSGSRLFDMFSVCWQLASCSHSCSSLRKSPPAENCSYSVVAVLHGRSHPCRGTEAVSHGLAHHGFRICQWTR